MAASKPFGSADTCWKAFKLALESKDKKIQMLALNCLHKLISHGVLKGEGLAVPFIVSTADGEASKDATKLLVFESKAKEEAPALAFEMMDTICSCIDLKDDDGDFQLSILKVVIAAATSPAFEVCTANRLFEQFFFIHPERLFFAAIPTMHYSI